MRSLLERFLKLPPELRLLPVAAVFIVPTLLARPMLPAGLFGWLLGGVVAIFAVLYAVLIGLRIHALRQGRRLDREITAQQVGPSRREIAEKEKGYKNKWLDGIDKLKRAKLSLYDLPWYIVLGEPGGGKTMTLLNSGMDFPMGKDELPGFGGTRNYNWWFTNSAVILDTAGRLVFDQEGTTDRAEWEAFLTLLKRRRGCPINGVVVALPADKLMSDSAEQRERSAAVLRDRLRQIQTILDIRFPVFLLVTKADLVAGFTEFFNDLDSVQRNQIFGWSRPGNFDTPFEPGEFSEDFDNLYDRLYELRLNFLSQDATPNELGWVYTYPEAFRSLQGRIQDYVDVLFSKNIFAEPLFFRGFYFTSALQEGRPILEILGEHLSEEELENLEGIFPQSRAFFIHDFYTRKVAKEQGMVFRSQRHINRMRLLKRSVLFIGLPMYTLLAVLGILGYRSYTQAVREPTMAIEQAAQLVEKYRDQQQAGAVWTVAHNDKTNDIKTALTLSARIDDASEQIRNPAGMGTLLFSSIGEDAEVNLQSIQRELLGYCVVRPAVASVEQALSAPTVPTPERFGAFNTSLRAYITLHFKQGDASLDDLTRFAAPDDTSYDGMAEALKRFGQNSPGGLGGRIAGGLTGDIAHRQRVILAGIDSAAAYWLTTADIAAHADYAWWHGLLQRCAEVRTAYRALIDDGERIASATDINTIEDAADVWRGHFPQSTNSTSPKLCTALDVHLNRAPRTEDSGSVKSIKQLLLVNRTAADTFWNDLETLLPKPAEGVDQQDATFAAECVRRIRDHRKGLAEAQATAQQAFADQLMQLGDVIDTATQTITPGARRAESALDTAVTRSLTRMTLEPAQLLDGWTTQLRELMSGDPPTVGATLDAAWDPVGMQRLVKAVDGARRRYRARLLVNHIRESLDGAALNDEGIARFVEDHDARPTTLRFEQLRNRHQASFLARALNSKQVLIAALDAPDSLVPDSTDIKELLEDRSADYVRHYMTTWSDAYTRFEFSPMSVFKTAPPDDWDAYRSWLNGSASDFKNQYKRYLNTFVNNALLMSDAIDSPTRAELQRYLADIDWPLDSRLAVLLNRSGPGKAIPDINATDKTWRDYTRAVERLRYRGLNDLEGPRPMMFPNLLTDDILAAEWLTLQLQYVVDYGAWLLWRDVYTSLRDEDLQPLGDNRPFFFDDGQYGGLDEHMLTALLAKMASIERFAQTLAVEGSSPRASGGADNTAWLTLAKRWQSFLDRPQHTIEFGYAPVSDDGLLNPSKYYRNVALELPGLRDEQGRDQVLTCAVAQARAFTGHQWQPHSGRVVVVLSDPTSAYQDRDVEYEPRLLELPSGEYGLIELIQQYGQPDGDGWRVVLTRDVHQIVGLADEPSDIAPLAVSFSIRFVPPEDGLPSPLPWPDPDVLAGQKPQAPTPDLADKH